MALQCAIEEEANGRGRPDMARLFFKACVGKTGRALLVWSGILNFLASLCAVTSIVVISYIFAYETDGHGHDVPVAILIAPLGLWAVLEYVCAWLNRRISSSVRTAAKLALVGNILNKPADYFDDWRVGRTPRGIENAVSTAAFAVRSLMHDGVSTLPRLLSPYIAIAILVMTMSVAVAASFVCWLLVFMAGSFWMARRHAYSFNLASTYSQRASSGCIDLFQNNVLLRQHQTAKSEYQQVAALLEAESGMSAQTQRQLDFSAMLQRALIVVTMSVMLLTSFSQIESTTGQLRASEIGELLSLLLLMVFSAMRMDGLGRMLINVREQAGRLRQVITMLDWDRRRRGRHPDEMAVATDGFALSLFKLRTQPLHNQHNQMAPAEIVSGAISLTIEEGESVGIVGLSGAGKSLLVRTMVGYIPACSGQAMLGKIDVQRVSPACLHRQVRLLEQDAPVLQRSLRDNLLYGLDSDVVTEARLQSAIAFAGLEPVVERIGGLNNTIGEPIHTFSMAERQRINIARVWLSDVQVLILDCALSALDADQELEMQRRIARRFQKCTIITISQRPQLMEHIGRLLFIEENEIIEDMKKTSVAYDFSRVSKFVSDGPRRTTPTTARQDPFPKLIVDLASQTDSGPVQH